MIREIDSYSGDRWSKYENERAERIKNGWKVVDANLTQSEIRIRSEMGNMSGGLFVRGKIVYEREHE